MSEETEVVATPEKKIPIWKQKKRAAGGQRKPVGSPAIQGPIVARPDRSKPTRVKFADRNRISFDGMEPGYHYHVFTDVPGRLEKMQDIGYEFVESDQQIGDYRVAEGSKMGKAVSKSTGGGQRGYLMRIKQEFYDEDQAAKAKRVDAVEAALKPAKAKEEYGPGLTND
jgi:hypothetical protein